LQLRFRPTVWPGEPVPVPRIPAPKVHRDGPWLIYDRLGLDGDMAEVPAEVYLREFRDTPAGDLDALVELCSLGMIRTTSTTDDAAYQDLPISSNELWVDALADMSELLPEDAHWDGDEDDRRNVWSGVSGFPVHAAEVALRVRAVQRATDHLLAWRNREPVQQAWRDCDDEGEAWEHFTDITGAALAEFHVRVEVHHEQPHLLDEFPIGGPYPTLYSVTMLQLVNDLAADVTYLRCANETCGRWFGRQRGRTTYGGNRMRGVMYCSNTCARAQYQREKRRRDRARRGAVDEHS
jgi:hypothetical protein